MKNHKGFRVASVLTAVLVLSVAGTLFLSGCGSTETASGDDVATQAANAGTSAQQVVSDTGASALQAVADTTEEQQLLYLREEEKLARDVYLALYDKWGVTEFSTIADSEVRHMASVKNLLDRYGLQDPVGGDIPGVFVNEELQSAYEDLVALGSQSVADAYQVGITIETMDIQDLEVLIALTTQSDVTRVAENLLRGSQSHLAALTRLEGEVGK